MSATEAASAWRFAVARYSGAKYGAATGGGGGAARRACMPSCSYPAFRPSGNGLYLEHRTEALGTAWEGRSERYAPLRSESCGPTALRSVVARSNGSDAILSPSGATGMLRSGDGASTTTGTTGPREAVLELAVTSLLGSP